VQLNEKAKTEKEDTRPKESITTMKITTATKAAA
jgi:hypothetical protein